MRAIEALSHRRLAALLSLLLLSGFAVAMVAVRVAKTGGDPTYLNLVWNLFLAWIPFVLALLVYDGFRRGAPRLGLAVGAALWLLFFPNAPYLVTDFELLRNASAVPIWFDVVLVSAAAWAGLLLGFVSLFLIHAVARRLLGTLGAWLAVLVVLGLTSFGIYLGRIRRWNSWDLFTQPEHLLRDVWVRVEDPLAYRETFAVTVLFTCFLTVAYLVFYSVARLGVAERAERS